MDYEYKVIPFIGHSKGSPSPAEVAAQLELVITAHVARGWECYQLCDVKIEVQPGCIAGLFGAKVQYVRIDQLIFRAERGSTAPSPARQITRHVMAPPSGVGLNTKQAEAADDIPAQPALTITSKHLDVWRQKSDEEIRSAAESLHDYTEEGRQLILSELARRSITIIDESSDEDDVAPVSFCYHCGSDIPIGSSTCGACGRGL